MKLAHSVFSPFRHTNIQTYKHRNELAEDSSACEMKKIKAEGNRGRNYASSRTRAQKYEISNALDVTRNFIFRALFRFLIPKSWK